MAENNAHTGVISREDCLNFAYSLFGLSRTNFHVSHAEFATQVADLAEDLYVSRYGYSAEILSKEKDRLRNVIWAAALLSHTQLYSSAAYEDIEAITNPEIAGYLYIVNPDTKLVPAQRIKRYLATMVCGGSLAKLIVFARAVVTIRAINENTKLEDRFLQWWLFHVLKQTKAVGEWSAYTRETWNASAAIVQTWDLSQLHKWPCVSRVEWRMDVKCLENDLNNLIWDD